MEFSKIEWSPDEGQSLVVYNTEFSGNEGGAILASNLGDLPSLRIWQSSFIENTSPGIVIDSEDEDIYDAVLCDNEGNDGTDPCDSIQIYGLTGPNWCLSFNENHP